MLSPEDQDTFTFNKFRNGSGGKPAGLYTLVKPEVTG